MKYIFALILIMSVCSQAQSSAKKLERAFKLLAEAPYWSYNLISVVDDLSCRTSVDYISPDNYRTKIDCGPELGGELLGILIGDQGWSKAEGDETWLSGQVDEPVLPFSQEDMAFTEDDQIEYLGPEADEPCEFYAVEGLEVCIDLTSGLPSILRFADEMGIAIFSFSYQEPSPIQPPIP